MASGILVAPLSARARSGSARPPQNRRHSSLSFPVSAPVKDEFVAEPTRTVIEESRHARSHVFALEERRRDFVNNPVCRADTSVEIRSHDPLADGIRQGWAVGESLGERPSVRFKCVIGERSGLRCSIARTSPRRTGRRYRF